MKNKTPVMIFLLLCCILLMPKAAVAADIRVLLGNYTQSTDISIFQGEYQIYDNTLNFNMGTAKPGDKINCKIDNNNMMKITINGAEIVNRATSFSLVPKDTEGIISFNNLRYRDAFSFVYYADSLINILNVVEMQHYLYGVVGREIGYGSPLEALKAQAVISRNFAYANINPENRYDVVATVSSQVYGGYNEEAKPKADIVMQAVNETGDEVMLYNGVCFPAYFSANAGGHTENIQNVWGGTSSAPFNGVPSPYDDNGTTSYHWTVGYSAVELAKMASAYAGKDIGEIKDIIISTADAFGNPTASGRVYRLEIVGTLGNVVSTKDKIRTLLGLKSSLFTIKLKGATEQIFMKNEAEMVAAETSKDLYAINATGEKIKLTDDKVTVISATGKRTMGDNAQVNYITIDGYGYGHGVGLSQIGAIGMANAGYTYQDILKHYYFTADGFSFSNLNILTGEQNESI